MNIEVAGNPKRVKIENMIGEPIQLPLSGEPDDLLMRDLGQNQHVRSYCQDIQAEGASLIFPSATGRRNLGPMFTAIEARINSTNNERAQLEQATAGGRGFGSKGR